MRKTIPALLAFYMTFVVSPALAQSNSHHKHHNHTSQLYSPIGVMDDHSHEQGGWMLSYAYSTMHMEGNRDGVNDVGVAQVLNDFVVSPTEMTMKMHMFGVMYGVTDKVMIMGMIPYKMISMDHINRMGSQFTTESEGVGDVKLSGIYTLHEQGNRKTLLTIGISLPVGSIDKRDDTPAGKSQQLPYPMQLGSGTYDFLPGIAFAEQRGAWAWGSQLKTTIRQGSNNNDYRLGNEYSLTLWGARKINRYINASLRVDGKKWGNIHGEDPELNPMMVPTSRTDLRAGDRVDLQFGIDLIAPGGDLQDNRLAIEVGIPIYQNLDGPQLELDYRLTVGWQLVF